MPKGKNNYYTPTSHNCSLHGRETSCKAHYNSDALIAVCYRTNTDSTDHHKDTHTSADGMSVIMETGERKTQCGMYVIQETEDLSCERVQLN